MRILIFLLTSFLIIGNSYPQNLSRKPKNLKYIHDTVYKTDTIIIKKSLVNQGFELSKEEFIGLLKGKNTMENSLSIFICALGVLFTLMAIFIAIVIYTQSKDFKERLAGVISKYESIIKGFIESKREDLKSQEESINQMILKYEENLKTAEAEQKIKLEETINELKSKKEIVDKQLKNSVVDAEFVLSGYNPLGPNRTSQKLHKCSICNFGFIVRDNSKDYLTLSGSTTMMIDSITNFYSADIIAKCPNCGNIDKLN